MRAFLVKRLPVDVLQPRVHQVPGQASNFGPTAAGIPRPQSPTPMCVPFVRLERFSFLILIARFVTLDP